MVTLAGVIAIEVRVAGPLPPPAELPLPQPINKRNGIVISKENEMRCDT